MLETAGNKTKSLPSRVGLQILHGRSPGPHLLISSSSPLTSSAPPTHPKTHTLATLLFFREAWSHLRAFALALPSTRNSLLSECQLFSNAFPDHSITNDTPPSTPCLPFLTYFFLSSYGTRDFLFLLFIVCLSPMASCSLSLE